jgi:c-di-GMP-binding flagellar brake protein YcgR
MAWSDQGQVDRRRSERVAARDVVELRLAFRNRRDLVPVTVRDISYHGMGVVAAERLPAAMGERLFGMFSFHGAPGHASVVSALFRLTVRRRRPDSEGWFLGLEHADLRESPWNGLVSWIKRDRVVVPWSGWATGLDTLS